MVETRFVLSKWLFSNPAARVSKSVTRLEFFIIWAKNNMIPQRGAELIKSHFFSKMPLILIFFIFPNSILNCLTAYCNEILQWNAFTYLDCFCCRKRFTNSKKVRKEKKSIFSGQQPYNICKQITKICKNHNEQSAVCFDYVIADWHVKKQLVINSLFTISKNPAP